MPMGMERVLGTPCPAALPDEQDTGYGYVYYQEDKKWPQDHNLQKQVRQRNIPSFLGDRKTFLVLR